MVRVGGYTGDGLVFSTRDVALVAILAALGGVVSIPVGYAGNMLGAVPLLPFGTGQLLSGVHVLWIVLAGLLVRQRGAAAATGALKGLVELTLFSFHGSLILPIALTEGLVAEAVLLLPGRWVGARAYLAGGLSASSNVLVLRFLVFQALPWQVIAFMWVLSFVSGAIVSGYLGAKVARIMEMRLGN
jgi:ABC-type thiamin/hydroxymethylpyrimidine transport system permease subunit